MALVKCKECGHEISDSAYFCPNCGYADYEDECECGCEPRSNAGKVILGIGCAALIVAAGVYGYHYFSKENRLEKTVEKGKKALKELEAMAKSQPTIKKLLSNF